MALNAVDITQSLLAYTIVTDKGAVITLLERNGVKLPQNPSDAEVTASVLLASGKSQNFKNELAKLLTSKAGQAGDDYKPFVGEMMGFTGIDDFAFTGWETFKNGPGDIKPVPLKISPTPTPVNVPAGKKGKTKAGAALGSIGKWLSENILTKDNINAGVQIGLTSINNRVQNKSNQVQAETNTLTQMQDDIRNQQGGAGAKGKLSTAAWIGIGVGAIAIVGLVIYLTKKK